MTGYAHQFVCWWWTSGNTGRHDDTKGPISCTI